MLDLQWKSIIWDGGLPFSKMLANISASPSASCDSLSFWNISNMRDETGLSLELDLLQGLSSCDI